MNPGAGDEVPVVRVVQAGPVAHVVLDRPDALNAITIALAVQLEDALRAAAEHANVVVVRGAGHNFSAGGDFAEVQRLQVGGAQALVPLFEHFGRACGAIAELPVPVVAAVEGYAMAGGFELMQACDVALVRDDAVIADNHLNFGQVPGGGGSQRLPRLIGHQRALGLILSGERISGAEAVAWGLAYRSFPAAEFDAGLESFVTRLAAQDPTAIARTKRLVREGLELPLAEGLARERAAVVEHLASDAGRAGIARLSGTAGARGA